jgi:hypothetical protein
LSGTIEIISKALGKRFGIPRTFGFENGRHIQTFDQQLYAIAKQAEWAKQDSFKTHILLLGGFHTMSCFVASIGKHSGLYSERELLHPVQNGIT